MKKILFLFLSIFSWNLFANFEVITLGNSSGVVVGTTTSYIIRDTKSKSYLGLDAGSTVNGLETSTKSTKTCGWTIFRSCRWCMRGYWRGCWLKRSFENSRKGIAALKSAYFEVIP